MPYKDRERQLEYWRDHARSPAGRATQQRARRNERRRSYQKKYGYEWHLRKMYGLSLFDVARMLAAQEGRCGLCGTDQPNGKHGKWCVDHDHGTGKARGILCSSCNVSLGHYEKIRDRAEGYLARHSTKSQGGQAN